MAHMRFTLECCFSARMWRRVASGGRTPMNALLAKQCNAAA